MEETVGGDWRGGCVYHTRRSSSHNPCYRGILLHISVASIWADASLHKNVRSDSRDDYGRLGSMSKDIIHSYFRNDV